MAESFPLADRPRLRPVEIFPVTDRGQRVLVLRDPADPSIQPIVVTDGAGQVLMLLDGQRSLGELSTALTLRGSSIGAPQLRAFVERLDEAGFLEGPRAEQRYAERAGRFRDAPVRAAVHAGGAYPSGPSELPLMLARGYCDANGPGDLPRGRQAGVGTPRALIAPHVDLHRGAPTYSWGYRALAEAEPAELYVVLGTCHTPVKGHFAATAKPYDTPLGAVPSEPEFLDRLARAWGSDLFEGEFSHAGEHSIEFQALFLAWALGTTGYQVVPVLVGSFHEMILSGETPAYDARVGGFLEALRSELEIETRRTLIIAGVDFAHVGRKFGDSFSADEKVAEWVKQEDLALIENIKRGDPDGFFADVVKDRDARKICGLSPMYTQLELLRDHPARLLMHDIAMEPQTESAVSFASLAID